MGDCTAQVKAESKAWTMARYQKKRFLSERGLPDINESENFPGRKHKVAQQ
jgi:hypothetical protein